MKVKDLIEILKHAEEDGVIFYSFGDGFPYTVNEARLTEYNGKLNGQVILS